MHEEYTALMSLAIDREATSAQMADLRSHVADCGFCASLWREWQALDVRLSAAPALAPPPFFAARVAARLQAGSQLRLRRRWLAPGLLLAWGSVIGLLWISMLIALWWGYRHPVEASLLLSSGAQALSGLVAMCSGFRISVAGLGRDPSLALLFAGLAGAAAVGVVAWMWVMAQSMSWRQAAMSSAAPEQVGQQ